jgi:hypothetical protein
MFRVTLAGLVVMCACSKGPPIGPTPVHTISGVIRELTPSGPVPVQGVLVQDLNGRGAADTDQNGRYSIPRVAPGAITIQISKSEFETARRDVTIGADTVVDFQIVRIVQTLWGFVTEETPEGRTPVAGVTIEFWCSPRAGVPESLVRAESDANGFYTATNSCRGGETRVFPSKPGYDPAPDDRVCLSDGVPCRWVTIAGATRFDIQMISR